jgi:hypothetical protein
MNNTMLWVIIAVAAVITLGATLYIMNNPNRAPATVSSDDPSQQPPKSTSTGQTGPAPGDRLPAALDGFSEKIRAEDVDPVFPGENHSANVAFTPISGSLYENVIESLGVSIFLFDDASKMAEVKSLLTQGITLEPTQIEEVEIGMGINPETGEIDLSWEEGPMLFFIASTLSAEARKDPQNVEILKRAATMAATLVLKSKK